MIQKIKIETPRLVLTPIDYNFTQDIFSNFTSEITHYMCPSPALNITETKNFIRKSMEKMEKGEELVFAILSKLSREFLGCTGIHKINTRTPELGIWLKKEAHGNKYGQETIISIHKWANKKVDFEYLIYPVDKNNVSSRKIPELLKGKINKEYKQKNMSDKTLNLIEYNIYKI